MNVPVVVNFIKEINLSGENQENFDKNRKNTVYRKRSQDLKQRKGHVFVLLRIRCFYVAGSISYLFISML